MSRVYHLLSYLPLNFLYILSSLVSIFLPHVYRRKVVKKNLVNSFPNISKFELENLIGNFYPPSKIKIDTKILDYLENKEILSGLGEMSHYYFLSKSKYPFFFKNLIKAQKNKQVLQKII